jgi:hypothetical protein
MTICTVLGRAASYLLNAAIVCLDQEKAYDHVAQTYLETVLSHFGFPQSLINALTVSYSPTFTNILDNGYPAAGFSVNCGARQGAPLAPMLFNLALEPLLAAFRLCLQGVILPWGSFKDVAFADDAYAGLSPGDVEPFCQTVRDYCEASNSKINIIKSSIISLHPSNHPLYGLTPLVFLSTPLLSQFVS